MRKQESSCAKTDTLCTNCFSNNYFIMFGLMQTSVLVTGRWSALLLRFCFCRHTAFVGRQTDSII